MMIHFRMNRISVNQFAILAENIPDSEINLSTELTFQYSEESKAIACIADFKFKANDTVFMVLKCQCEFKVKDEDWNQFHSEKGLTLPKQILEFFAVHTIGTSRGILFSRTEGTPFNQIILPPINVENLIERDLSFPCDNV